MEFNSELIAIWGAVLSSFLGGIKVWELWRSRRKIEVSYGFDSRPEVGNEIIIRNISDKPMIITYWELQFCVFNWFRWVPDKTENPGEDRHDIFVAAHTSLSLPFRGECFFKWGRDAFKGKRLYLELQIAGKSKPIRFFVYK